MNRRVTRWLMPVLRYLFCAAAIVYLVMVVPWYDHARLNDAGKTRVRVLEIDEAAGTLVVEHNGKQETITWQQVSHADGVPEIKYGISGVVGRMDIGLGLLAILLFLPVPVLQSIRLVWMLGVQDVRMSYWNAFKLSYAGNFFNFALPGFFGGDMIKAYYVSHFTHRKTEAVTTVFLDRIVGLSGLMLVATVTFALSWQRPEWNAAYRTSLATGFVVLWVGLFAGCLVLFSRRLRYLTRLPQVAERLPAAEQILRIGRATVSMRAHWVLVAMSLLNTIVLQLIVVVAAYTMARALDMAGHFTLYFVFVPIGFLIAAIPISPPNGFGVMEAAYVQFFTVGGLNPASAAVAFALANRLTQLVWALPGVLVPLLGAHLPSKADLLELEAARDETESGEPREKTPEEGNPPIAASVDPASGQ